MIKVNIFCYMLNSAYVMSLERIKHAIENTKSNHFSQFYSKGYKFSF